MSNGLNPRRNFMAAAVGLALAGAANAAQNFPEYRTSAYGSVSAAYAAVPSTGGVVVVDGEVALPGLSRAGASAQHPDDRRLQQLPAVRLSAVYVRQRSGGYAIHGLQPLHQLLL